MSFSTPYTPKEARALVEGSNALKRILEGLRGAGGTARELAQRAIDEEYVAELAHRNMGKLWSGVEGEYRLSVPETAVCLALRNIIEGPSNPATWEDAASMRPGVLAAWGTHCSLVRVYGSWAPGILAGAYPDLAAFEYARVVRR